MSVLAPFSGRKHDHRQCVRSALAAAETICAQAGVRLTPIRRRVLELVWGGHEPVGAYELMDQLAKEGRRPAPPTVYRALEFLLENGLVHRIESLNAYVGCGDPLAPHHGQFLICRKCHAVAELDEPGISRIVDRKAHDLGFAVQAETVEILGLCAHCRSEAGADE
jgi:Fur family zinc uptake transcriptional regulator